MQDYEYYKTLPRHELKRKLKRLKHIVKSLELKILIIEQIQDSNSKYAQP